MNNLAQQIKAILINEAIEDRLPLDMTQLDPAIFEPVIRQLAGEPGEKFSLGDCQIVQLQQKDWNAVPTGAFLDLFPEDFQDQDTWEQVCQQTGIPVTSPGVSVLYIGIKDHSYDL
jgi:hypothetical protein